MGSRSVKASLALMMPNGKLVTTDLSESNTLTLSTIGYGKKNLVVLSEWGYWGEELIGPLDVLTKAGYQLDFKDVVWQEAAGVAPSIEEGYLDPLLNKLLPTHTMEADNRGMNQIFDNQLTCLRRFR